MRRLGPKRIDGIDGILLLLGAASLLTMPDRARAADYYVDPGNATAFATVQSAVDAVSGQSEFNRANIFIAPGNYHELVTVDKPYISFIGTGASPNATTISFSRAPSGFSYGQAVEIQEDAAGFMARNLTFENSIPDKNVSAGVAVRSSADRVIFDNVRFLGYQDTLFLDDRSRQYLRDCFITGDTDFIFGREYKSKHGQRIRLP